MNLVKSRKSLLLRLSGVLLGVVLAMSLTGREIHASNGEESALKEKTIAFKELKHYDRTARTEREKDWPPWIPETEGQKEVRVQVLDAITMQPVEGAIVVGGYYGTERNGKVCERSESTVADAEGWAVLPNDQDLRIGNSGSSALRGPRLEFAYKRGYQMAITVYEAVPGGHGEWYVRKWKPMPFGTPKDQKEKISSRKFSDDHKSALMETKERSRIYLMPSTAKTKKERRSELVQIQIRGAGCSSKMPLEFSESEGGLAASKALYQEMLDVGYSENSMKAEKKRIERYAKSYQEFRQGIGQETLNVGHPENTMRSEEARMERYAKSDQESVGEEKPSEQIPEHFDLQEVRQETVEIKAMKGMRYAKSGQENMGEEKSSERASERLGLRVKREEAVKMKATERQ
jgi:hypothetical protein